MIRDLKQIHSSGVGRHFHNIKTVQEKHVGSCIPSPLGWVAGSLPCCQDDSSTASTDSRRRRPHSLPCSGGELLLGAWRQAKEGAFWRLWAMRLLLGEVLELRDRRYNVLLGVPTARLSVLHSEGGIYAVLLWVRMVGARCLMAPVSDLQRANGGTQMKTARFVFSLSLAPALRAPVKQWRWGRVGSSRPYNSSRCPAQQLPVAPRACTPSGGPRA